MGDRFFAAVSLEGHLDVPAMPESAPWDITRLRWLREEELDLILLPEAGDRRIRSYGEFVAVLSGMSHSARTRQIWIHESLESDVRELWEAQHTRPAGRDADIHLSAASFAPEGRSTAW